MSQSLLSSGQGRRVLRNGFVGLYDGCLLADPGEFVCFVAVDHVGGEHLFEQLEVDGALDPAAAVGGFGDAVGEEGGEFFYVLGG